MVIDHGIGTGAGAGAGAGEAGEAGAGAGEAGEPDASFINRSMTAVLEHDHRPDSSASLAVVSARSRNEV